MQKLSPHNRLSKKRVLVTLLITVLCLIGLFVFYLSVMLTPSNDKHWQIGYDRLSGIKRSGNNVSIKNVRDFTFVRGKRTGTGYIPVNVKISDIERVWFMYEPFTVEPFTHFTGIAHTYFTFDIKDHEPLVLSVEARREEGETYSAYEGALNKFELQYIWGTETDISSQRVFTQNLGLYMFPLQISKEAAQSLFIQVVESSIALEKHPRFYNSLTSNCTNELAKNGNLIKKGSIPYDKAWIFPGYSDAFLYKLQLIPSSKPLSEMKEKYNVTKKMQELDGDPNFSKEIRKYLD